MSYTVKSIAVALGARFAGDGELAISCACEPGSAGPQALALAMEKKYATGLSHGDAQAALLWPEADWRALGLRAAIFVPRPRFALSALTALMDQGPEIAPGVHPSAIVDPSAQIGAGVAIGPLAVIGRDAVIGAGARIAAHVSIAEQARVGAGTLLLAGVRIGARVVLGERVIVQPGAVVGADGFSYVTPERHAVEEVRATLGERGQTEAQSWVRIHSLGAVRIGDDVELGANVAIDRGTIADTMIGRGSKLDNLVHIGHNVIVGEDCLLCGQVGVAGSVRIGNRVVLAGQCGVSDHVFIGDDVIAGGASKIFTNVPTGRVLLGSPAMPMERHVASYKALRRLPRLFKRVAELQKSVSKSVRND